MGFSISMQVASGKLTNISIIRVVISIHQCLLHIHACRLRQPYVPLTVIFPHPRKSQPGDPSFNLSSSHTSTRFCLACRPGRHDWVQEQCRLPWRQLWMVKPLCFLFSFLFSGWLNLPVFVFCFVFVFCSLVEQSPCFRKLDFPFYFQIFCCQVDLPFFQVDLPSSCWRHHLLWSWGCRRLPSQSW